MKTHTTTKPAKPVIIYDGKCNFCVSGIRRIQRKDQANQFVYTPRQTPNLHALYPQLATIESKDGMRFIDPDGRVYRGADAIYQIYRRLGKYRYVTWIYLVPVLRTLLKGIYWLISTNRSRLGGANCETGTCSTEEVGK